MSFSDHYLVGTYKVPTVDIGPKAWHFPADLLENEYFVLYVQQSLLNFDYLKPLENWEKWKIHLTVATCSYTKFWNKQWKFEIQALRQTLKYINFKIFHGDLLENDRLHIQNHIE